MSRSQKIDTGQSESTEDKKAVCDESDLITESIDILETSDIMGQKDRALHSNSDLSEGNLSDGKSDSYEFGSKCDGSPRKFKGNKNRDSDSKVEKDGALKGAESNLTSVAMGTDTTDKSQAKKEKRKRDRKKRKQNKKDRAVTSTEGGEEKENNGQKVDSSETDISEKDEIVKVKEKLECKPKKENGKKRKNSVAKKGEKCSDMNENNLQTGDQLISLSGSKSQELSSDSEQLRSDSANSGNEEAYDLRKENTDANIGADSQKKQEKPTRSSSPSKKKKRKKKLKNVQSVDEADDKEALNLTLEISKTQTPKQSGKNDFLCDTENNANNQLTSAEQKSEPEQSAEDEPHSSECKADNSKPQASVKTQQTTDETKTSEPNSTNFNLFEPQNYATSGVVATETTDDDTEITSEELKSEPVAKATIDDVTEDRPTSNATTDIKELLSEIKDVLSEFPGDDCRESSVDPEDYAIAENIKNSEPSNQNLDIIGTAEIQSETSPLQQTSCEETNSAKINNSRENFKDTVCKDLSMEKRSENLETEVEQSESLPEQSETLSKQSEALLEHLQTSAEQLETSFEKSETLPEQSETLTGQLETSFEKSETLPEPSETLTGQLETSFEKSETLPEQSETSTEQLKTSDLPDSVCKNNIPSKGASDNSTSLNSEVNKVLSNLVDSVQENLKSVDDPKVAESVVPDHVDLSDIEDVSVDSIGSEDLPKTKKCDSEIHVPLNPSKLRDELMKLENENLSVIADLEKDANLLAGNQTTDEQEADSTTSQSKEDNSHNDSSNKEADVEDGFDLNDRMESSVDFVDGFNETVPKEFTSTVMDGTKSDVVTKPVISVQHVGVETEVDEEKVQMREELERLKEELNSTKDALQKSQSRTYRHQIHSNLTVSTLQAQLHKKDMEMKQKQIGHDQQIEAIISRLFLLEGEIRREQKQILGLLELKETVIDKQSHKIEELINTNDKLSMALKLHNIGTNGLVTPLNRSTGDLSPTNKSSFKDKESPKNMKLRWGTMKEKLRRHKSSFELHHPDRMETLEEGTFRYGSQENLSNTKRVNDRKERCRSYAEYPQSLRNSPLVELPNENEYQKSDGSETTSLNMAEGEINGGQCSPSSSSDDNSIISDISSIGPRRGSITSLPNGVGLTSTNRGSSPNIYKDVRELSPNEKPVKQSSPSSHESNPFKSIKTMLKRRGSKLRSKKRNTSDQQLNDSEPKEALKNHFKKYEMH